MYLKTADLLGLWVIVLWGDVFLTHAQLLFKMVSQEQYDTPFRFFRLEGLLKKYIQVAY
jgi:hypothetical protein